MSWYLLKALILVGGGLPFCWRPTISQKITISRPRCHHDGSSQRSGYFVIMSESRQKHEHCPNHKRNQISWIVAPVSDFASLPSLASASFHFYLPGRATNSSQFAWDLGEVVCWNFCAPETPQLQGELVTQLSQCLSQDTLSFSVRVINNANHKITPAFWQQANNS